MKKHIVLSGLAPRPIGPYSQATRAGGFVFLSGQIPLDMSGNVVSDDVSAQTEQVLHNLHNVLVEANSDFDHIVKATIFLADMNDFAAVNAVYEKYFPENPPARSTIEVSRLPRDVKVEIEAIALTHDEEDFRL